MDERIFAIVNPISANGKTAKEWPEFEKELRRHGYESDAVYTDYPLHAVEITREAIKSGYNTIMSVGGDGTMNEVVNGFFEDGALLNEAARLVVFSRGTGCDFIRSLDMKKGLENVIDVLNRNETIQCDVGRVRYNPYDKGQNQRYFLNISDIGIGAETAKRVNLHSKAMKGFLAFLLSALTTIALYKNKHFEISIDDEVHICEKLNSIIVANGRYFGGGMEVAPGAKLDDGFFDIIVFGDLSKPDLLKSFHLIYKGGHLGHPKLRFYKGKKVTVRCRETALLELDGELPGTADAEFEILEKALNLMV